MKFFDFGTENQIRLLFLAGYTAEWRAAMPMIHELSKSYHVIVDAYDGFNANEPDTIFTSVEDEGRKAADFLAEHYDGKIDIIYGVSMGGMVMTELMQDERIQVHTAIADGFTVMYYPDFGTDMLNRMTARVMTNLFWSMTHSHPGLTARLLGRTEDQVRNFICQDAVKQSYFNAEYSQIGYHYKFRSFNKADSYIWHSDSEKREIENAKYLRECGIVFHHKIFYGLGHGGLTNQPGLLKQEIDLAYRGLSQS